MFVLLLSTDATRSHCSIVNVFFVSLLCRDSAKRHYWLGLYFMLFETFIWDYFFYNSAEKPDGRTLKKTTAFKNRKSTYYTKPNWNSTIRTGACQLIFLVPVLLRYSFQKKPRFLESKIQFKILRNERRNGFLYFSKKREHKFIYFFLRIETYISAISIFPKIRFKL